MYGYILVAFLVASAKGQLVLEGSCNYTATDAVRNLNISQFFGEWYQIARIENEFEIGECAASVYSGIVENGVLFNGTAENRQVVNKTIHWNNGTFTTGSNGVYVFRYPDMTLDLLVLTTDYTGYGLLYSCVQNATHKTVWSWQISRTKQLTTEQSNLVNAAISINDDLRNATWKSVGQTDADCKTSSSISLIASPVLLSLVLCNMVSKLF